MIPPDRNFSDNQQHNAEDTHQMPLEDWLDLHPFQPRDIPDVVREYLHECRAAGLLHIRLVHGKGIGFQREVVRRVLQETPFVLHFQDAPAEHGHWGATVVVLKSLEPGEAQ